MKSLTALMAASQCGHDAIVTQLISAGSLVNAHLKTTKWTAIMLAVLNNQVPSHIPLFLPPSFFPPLLPPCLLFPSPSPSLPPSLLFLSLPLFLPPFFPSPFPPSLSLPSFSLPSPLSLSLPSLLSASCLHEDIKFIEDPLNHKTSPGISKCSRMVKVLLSCEDFVLTLTLRLQLLGLPSTPSTPSFLSSLLPIALNSEAASPAWCR